MKRVLVIIPAYNEEKNISKIVEEVRQYKLKKNNSPYMIDTLVINDCSTDDTSNICRTLNTKVIDLPCNLGIGGAVQTGYLYASKNGYDIAVQIDGDGQHDPSFLESVFQPLVLGEADLVIGSRFIERSGFQSSTTRRIGIRFLAYLLNLLGKNKITDPTSGFRACNKNVIELFSKYYPKDYPEPESIMSVIRNGFRVKEIPVVMRERHEGVSSINLRRSIYYMLKVTLAIIIDFLRKKNIRSEV